MGVARGCGEQEVGVASGSEWNLWVWLLGVVVRRYSRVSLIRTSVIRTRRLTERAMRATPPCYVRHVYRFGAL